MELLFLDTFGRFKIVLKNIAPLRATLVEQVALGKRGQVPNFGRIGPFAAELRRKTRFPKFEFSRQKGAHHRVGNGNGIGLEVSGSEFRPDRPIVSRVTARKSDFPNFNFPAKNELTIGWGMY